MAFSLQGDSDIDTSCGNFHYEPDAVPFSGPIDRNNSSISSKTDPNFHDPLIKEAMSDNLDDDVGPLDCDRIVNNAMSDDDMGQFKFENNAVEIANSSSVHIGNSITQKTDITFERATSVFVDRRQWNYVNCPDPNKVNSICIK